MRKGLIGKKLGMTHIYTEDGVAVPVTAIEVGPCPVISLRTQKRNGYSALQLGFGSRKVKNVTKPVLRTLKEAKLESNPPMIIREIRLEEDSTASVGDVLKADIFAKDEFVDVTGQTKGRGFAGVVRRWKFGGGRASHGGARVRRSGSIGMCAAPGKVYKGRKMPGHMGDVRQTILNLKVMDVRPDVNLLLVKGSIPGANGCFVIVRNAIKKH